jgi:putative two-component system response regulator
MSILIVDDNATNLVLLRGLSAQVSPLPVQTFDEPFAALDWCRGQPLALAIVDYMMPGIDGIAFTERLRSLPETATVPVVVVTAQHDRAVRERALQAGATDFLTKPLDSVEFKLRVRNLLELSLSRRELEARSRRLADEVAAATATVAQREQELVERLSRAAEFRDPETGAHIARMARFSRLIAEGLGMDREFCDAIMKAAPMHDIGKLATPDHILLKPGRLTEEELVVMRRHAAIGAQILSSSASPLLELARVIAQHHHERFDGSGYPDGVSGTRIPIAGRIVAVADVFDALTSARPYKRAWSLEDSRRYIESGIGTHFCPDCAHAFLSRWEDVLRIRHEFPDDEEPCESNKP